MKSVTAATMSVLLSVCLNALSAEENQQEVGVARPATFIGGPEAFAAKLNFPSFIKEFPVVINCFVTVNRKGNVMVKQCLANEEKHGQLQRGINRALNGKLFKPAFNGQEPIATKVFFSVYYIRDDQGTAIIVTPNLGLSSDQLGHEYVEAQPSKHPDWKVLNCGRGITSVIRMAIDDQGKASDIHVVNSNIGEDCRRRIIKWYEALVYIPADHNGQAVPSLHQEWFVTN